MKKLLSEKLFLKNTSLVALSVLSLLLSGCGGGGGSSEAPQTQTPDTHPATPVNPTDITQQPSTTENSAVKPGQALLGPISGGLVTLAVVNGTSPETLCQTTTTVSTDLEIAGKIEIPTDCIVQPDHRYLVTVTGGEDIDVNDDGILDPVSTPILGSLHAIVSGRQFAQGNWHVTSVTESIYQAAQLLLTQADNDTLLSSVLTRATENLLNTDIDGDGTINYQDAIQWHPRQHQAFLRDVNFIAATTQHILQGVNSTSSSNLQVKDDIIHLDTGSPVRQTFVANNRIYLSTDTAFMIFTLNEAKTPALTALLPVTHIHDFVIAGQRAYLARGEQGVEVIELGVSGLLKSVLTLTGDVVYKLAHNDSTLFLLSESEHGIAVVSRDLSVIDTVISHLDISTSASPRDSHLIATASALYLTLPVIEDIKTPMTDVIAIDVSNPAELRLTEQFQQPGSGLLAANGDNLFIEGAQWDQSVLQVLDVKNPTSTTQYLQGDIGCETNRLHSVALAGDTLVTSCADQLTLWHQSPLAAYQRISLAQDFWNDAAINDEIISATVSDDTETNPARLIVQLRDNGLLLIDLNDDRLSQHTLGKATLGNLTETHLAPQSSQTVWSAANGGVKNAIVTVHRFPKLNGTPLCEINTNDQPLGTLVLNNQCTQGEGLYMVTVTKGQNTDVDYDGEIDPMPRSLKLPLHGIFTEAELKQSPWQVTLFSEALYQRLWVPLTNGIDEAAMREQFDNEKANLLAEDDATLATLFTDVRTAVQSGLPKSEFSHSPVMVEPVKHRMSYDYPDMEEFYFKASDITLSGDRLLLNLTSTVAYEYSDMLESVGSVLFLNPDTLATESSVDFQLRLRNTTVVNDMLYTIDERFRLQAHDISDPSAPQLRGVYSTNVIADTVTNTAGEIFHLTKNKLLKSRVGDATEGLQMTEVLQLDHDVLASAQSIAVKGDTAYIVQRQFTPGIAMTYRNPQEDLAYTIRSKWSSLPKFPNIKQLPSGPVDDFHQWWYKDLGDDIVGREFLKEDLFLATMIENAEVQDSLLRAIFTPLYLSDSMTYSVQLIDISDGANPKMLSVPIRKRGQFIESLSVDGDLLTLTLRTDLNNDRVDAVELWDIANPQEPRWLATMDEDSYPRLVSPQTRFISPTRAISFVTEGSTQTVRLLDTTDLNAVSVLKEATLPKSITESLFRKVEIQGTGYRFNKGKVSIPTTSAYLFTVDFSEEN